MNYEQFILVQAMGEDFNLRSRHGQAPRSYRGVGSDAPPVRVHFVKSISFWHPLQVCFLSNSSEKISASFPQLGHLHIKDFRFLNC